MKYFHRAKTRRSIEKKERNKKRMYRINERNRGNMKYSHRPWSGNKKYQRTSKLIR